MSKSSGVIVLALDPGTGFSSPTGVAVFDSATRDIIESFTIGQKGGHATERIRFVASGLESHPWEVGPQIAAIEVTLMQGHANTTFQRLIGGLMCALPKEMELEEVHNTTVKKLVGGNGHSDKREVALGVAHYFKDNVKSYYKVLELMDENKWDQLDALAIGIAAVMIREARANGEKKRVVRRGKGKTSTKEKKRKSAPPSSDST